MLLKIVFFLALTTIGTHGQERTPEQLTKAVIDQLLQHDEFKRWTYGCGIIQDAMWLATTHFSDLDYANQSNAILDGFETTKGQLGYNILNNVTIPWAYAVGDFVGLYPFAYLDRAEYYGTERNTTDDLFIARTVAKKYVLGWPVQLPDGTFSRKNGWEGQPAGAGFLWADDMYMGLTLLDRLSIFDNDKSYVTRAAEMKMNFAKYMQDTKTGLFWHGYNYDTKEHSCCFWGRANGWIMMSHVEALLALKQFPADSWTPKLVDLFQSHAKGTLAVQSTDGRWHQVLDQPTSYLETSVTSMFLWSFTQGVINGWLDKGTFEPVIHRAYEGLTRAILPNGTVTGICMGTGIGTDLAFYDARPTKYLSSSPGLGSVVRALVSYDEFLKA